TLRFWDLATRRELRQLERPQARSAVSPDGKLLALFTRQGKLGLVDSETGKQVRGFPPVLSGASSLTFAPDGRTLFVAAHNDGVRRWDVATGREHPPIPIKEVGVFGLAASAASRYLPCRGPRR